MYSTILQVQIQPDRTDEAIRVLQEGIAPALKAQPGFKTAYLLGIRSENRVVYVTFWENEENIRFMDESGAFGEAMASFVPLLAGPPSREIYEVYLSI